jgi:hypothetical protein
MKNIKVLILTVFVLTLVYTGCNKKQEQQDQQQNLNQPKEQFVDKEKELKEKEELLRIREENLNKREQDLKAREEKLGISGTDTTKKQTQTTDTTKTKTKEKDKEKTDKKNKEKEKELNKKLDSPTTTIKDYLEYIQRGVADKKKFDQNIKKASQQWQSNQDGAYNRMKNSYKTSSKFTLVSDPVIVSQENNKATVKVKVQVTNKTKKGDEVKDMNITYNLVADKNGKWLIKNNAIQK